MLGVLITAIVIILIYIYFTTDEENVGEEEITDKEFESRFVYSVSRIDKGNINWTIKSLKSMKKGYKHYSDNHKALSILRVLENGVKQKDNTVIQYIKSCHKTI